jgi:hypothetical protein
MAVPTKQFRLKVFLEYFLFLFLIIFGSVGWATFRYVTRPDFMTIDVGPTSKDQRLFPCIVA